MNPIRIYLAIAVSVVLAVVLALGVQNYIIMRDKAALSDGRGQTLKATDGIIADTDTTAAQRVHVDIGVADARTNYHTQLEGVMQHEPTVRDRNDRPIPDSVRELARTRRLSRERSGRAVVGSEAQPSDTNASQR